MPKYIVSVTLSDKFIFNTDDHKDELKDFLGEGANEDETDGTDEDTVHDYIRSMLEDDINSLDGFSPSIDQIKVSAKI